MPKKGRGTVGFFKSEKGKRREEEQELRAKLAHFGLDDLSDPKNTQLALLIVEQRG